MAIQPTGTVTLLFTDIEGSTQLLNRLGTERYGQALHLHRRLMREAFDRHDGYEVDYEGDAFFVAFARAEDAVAAAAEAQEALAAADWPEEAEIRVRCGVHTGEPVAVPPKYVGIDVHKAARIMAAGHGGQVLLSAATVSQIVDVEAIGLGEHRLKDLLQPEPLYQLVVEGLPSEFPALKTLGNRPTNLPVQPNALIGREQEVAELTALLREETVRLLTLTGTGGTGKTRLALQAAAELLDEFESGVFVVSLAPISDPALVVSTIAQTLSVREVPGEELIETLRSYLEQKQMLLVLDNFEQVIEAAPALAVLLARCSQLTLLVTSRERIRLSAERVFAVPPMALPAPGDTRAALANEAIALFVARAQAVRGSFQLTPENEREVAAICVRLDGLPLAIELAAARAGVLSPRALLARLDQRLKLLTHGAQDLDERQRTLRATIDWSRALLSQEERALFARLAVFVDGCRLDAAEAVCDANGELGMSVLDGLTSLVEKSLIQQKEDPDGEPRYWMLETIHEYALERLEESHEANELRTRHAEWALALAEEAEPFLWGGRDPGWLALIQADYENCRAALSWGHDSNRPELALPLAVALGAFWELRGHFREGDTWMVGLLAQVGKQSRSGRARALWWAGNFAFHQHDLTRAKSLTEAGIGIFRDLRDIQWIARSQIILGNVAQLAGETATAKSAFEEAAAAGREARDRSTVGLAVNNLANLSLQQGDLGRARLLFEEALALFEELGESEGVALSLINLGSTAAEQGDLDDAKARFSEGVRLALGLGNREGLAYGLEGVARVAASEGESERAAVLLGAATAVFEAIGGALQPFERDQHERTASVARASLGDEVFNAMIRRGAQLELAEAASCALEAAPPSGTPA